MKHTPQLAKSASVARCSSLADVAPLAGAAEDHSRGLKYAGLPSDAIASSRIEDALVRTPPDAAHTRPMTPHELTASIAHEIIQPLAAIVANGETCLRWLGKDEPQLDEAR